MFRELLQTFSLRLDRLARFVRAMFVTDVDKCLRFPSHVASGGHNADMYSHVDTLDLEIRLRVREE